jgi:hypothetical protein
VLHTPPTCTTSSSLGTQCQQHAILAALNRRKSIAHNVISVLIELYIRTQVAKTMARPALGEFKDILTAALKLDTDEGQIASFFRKGYKTRTWWEDEKSFPLEESDGWRT